MFHLILSVTLFLASGALWGIVVGEREAYTWKTSVERRISSFTGVDYHGNRMLEVAMIAMMQLILICIDLYLFSLICLILANVAFTHIFYRASYNIKYYGKIFVDRRKVDSVYRVFKFNLPHPSTKALIIFYTIFCLVMTGLIYLNEVNWNI
jgi:hypothetical protein